jgi:hypothetical protein
MATDPDFEPVDNDFEPAQDDFEPADEGTLKKLGKFTLQAVNPLAGVQQAGADLLTAVTPIPVLTEAKEQITKAAEQNLGQARENIGIPADKQTSDPLEMALQATKNAMIPIPTPGVARAVGETILPQTPLDVVLPGLGAAADLGGRGLQRMAPDLAMESFEKVANAPLFDEAAKTAQAATLKAAQTQSSFKSAITSAKAARDEAFKSLIRARKELDEFVTVHGEAPELRGNQRRLNNLRTEVSRWQGKADKFGSDIKNLQQAASQQPPHIDAADVVPPGKATPFKPPRGQREVFDRIAPEQVAEATKYVQTERLADESFEEFFTSVAMDPKLQERLQAQKRGVVPMSASRAAGAKLGADDFIGLKPGQLPKKGTLDAQAAAASAIENVAAQDLYSAAREWMSGVPIEQLQDKIAWNLEAIIKASGVKSEMGRALNATKLTDAQRSLLKVSKAAFKQGLMEDPGKLADFLREVGSLPTDAIAQRILTAKRFVEPERTMIGMLQEGRAASLLTYPITFLRNTVGNSMAAMSHLVEPPLAGLVDFAMAKASGTPQQRMIYEGVENAFGMGEGLKSSAVDALNVLRGEMNLGGFGSEFALQKGQIPGKLGQVVRFPFRVLDATDTFFKGVIGKGELHRLAFRKAAVDEGLTGAARAERVQQLIKNPTPDMLDGAISRAKEFTFQEPLTGSLRHIANVFNEKDRIGVISKLVVPFFKTPVNVARFALKRLPGVDLMTAGGAVETGARAAFLKNGTTRGQFSDAVARNLVGVGALTSSAIALYSNEGRITGSPPKDQNVREMLERTGWKPYSIRVGNIYVPYRGFEPAASYMAAVADWAADMRQNPDDATIERAPRLMQAWIKSFVNQPFLTSVKDMLDAIENPQGGRAKAMVRSQAASLVPTGIAAVARTMDSKIRQPETVVEAMMSRIPELSKRVRPKLTRWGEPVMRTTFAFGLADKPYAPADPVEKMLLELEMPSLVGFPDTRLGGRKLTADEYNELLQMAGGNIRKFVEASMSQTAFRDAPREIKIKALQGGINKYRDMAADAIRPKAELRNLGVSDRLQPEELEAMNRILKSSDYQLLKDKDRREVISEWIREAKRLRMAR